MNICWQDRVGDRWEEEGIDPGRIYESGETLGPNCLPGIMLVTKDIPPGKAPQYPWHVSKAIVRLQENGKTREVDLVNETGCKPVFVANWMRLQPTFC